MQRCSSFICALSIAVLCLLSATSAVASNANISGLSEWDVTSFKVNLLNHQGANGDIQVDQNEWVHLGANHLEGGDITYLVQTGPLSRSDILEVWVDGFSTSNSLDIGPTLFIGTGKNRFEQINRVSGDAWRPFVFRFADDAQYGDVTDPSNRNENWRIRYPSSKYEVRRIDKAPNELLDYHTLPIRISITGAEDYIIKRLEVVVYRSGHGRLPVRYLAGLSPQQVRLGDRITCTLTPGTLQDNLRYYIVDTEGREYRVYPQLGTNRDEVWLYAKGNAFSRSGSYHIKVINRSSRGQQQSDSEYFEFVRPRVIKQSKPTPVPMLDACVPPCLPAVPLPVVPQAPPGVIVPVVPQQQVFVPSVAAVPQIAPVVPVVPPAAVAASPGAQRGFTIQIGAFSAQSSARSLVDKLRSFGYDAYISESVRGHSRLFRVRVGRYANKSHAHRDAGGLQQRGFETWITTMS